MLLVPAAALVPGPAPLMLAPLLRGLHLLLGRGAQRSHAAARNPPRAPIPFPAPAAASYLSALLLLLLRGRLALQTCADREAKSARAAPTWGGVGAAGGGCPAAQPCSTSASCPMWAPGPGSKGNRWVGVNTLSNPGQAWEKPWDTLGGTAGQGRAGASSPGWKWGQKPAEGQAGADRPARQKPPSGDTRSEVPAATPGLGCPRAARPQLPALQLSWRPVSSSPRPKRSSPFTLKEVMGGLASGGGRAGLASSSVSSERSSRTGNSSWRSSRHAVPSASRGPHCAPRQAPAHLRQVTSPLTGNQHRTSVLQSFHCAVTGVGPSPSQGPRGLSSARSQCGLPGTFWSCPHLPAAPCPGHIPRPQGGVGTPPPHRSPLSV